MCGQPPAICGIFSSAGQSRNKFPLAKQQDPLSFVKRPLALDFSSLLFLIGGQFIWYIRRMGHLPHAFSRILGGCGTGVNPGGWEVATPIFWAGSRGGPQGVGGREILLVMQTRSKVVTVLRKK